MEVLCAALENVARAGTAGGVLGDAMEVVVGDGIAGPYCVFF